MAFAMTSTFSSGSEPPSREIDDQPFFCLTECESSHRFRFQPDRYFPVSAAWDDCACRFVNVHRGVRCLIAYGPGAAEGNGVAVEFLMIEFYQVGSHENFYVELKSYLKSARPSCQ